MKNSLLKGIWVVLALISASCEKPDVSEKKRLIIESLEIIQDSIRIQTRVHSALEGISDHGYCWAVFPELPHLQYAQHTCYGPIHESFEFTGTLKPGKGSFIVRAFIVQNGFVYYSNSKAFRINE